MRTLVVFTCLLISSAMSCTMVAKVYSTVEGSPVPPPAVSMRSLPPRLYAGDSLVEEKIIEHSVIVRATMTGFSPEVVLVTDAYHGGTDNRYTPVMNFNLDVSEYLKGTGPTSIVAVWVETRSFESIDDASDALAFDLAERDDRWDDREAIIFLRDVNVHWAGTALHEMFQLPDHYLLAFGDRYYSDDRYSLHSSESRIWLPAAVPEHAEADSREYLLDVPPTDKTITLGDLKQRIVEVTAEYEGGEGSEEYRTCVLEKYRYLRNQRNWPEERGGRYTLFMVEETVDTGQSGGTEIGRRETPLEFFSDVDTGPLIDVRLDGRDSALFSFDYSTSLPAVGPDAPYHEDWYIELVKLARPLPSGQYVFDIRELYPGFEICNFVVSNTWQVTASPPIGYLHEFFFDPVADGSYIAADNDLGVLHPATFTNTSGASSNLSRLEWESGTVRLSLTSHTDLEGHVLDFITMDGTVSLSLVVADATVDSSNALNWAVETQPWEDGDRLMVRIHAGTCEDAVPDPENNPELVSDCEALLTAKEVLDPNGVLNWSVRTPIEEWEGISLIRYPDIVLIDNGQEIAPGGISDRVGGIELYGMDLAGRLAPQLGELTELKEMRIEFNSLGGEIPSELGNLVSLETLSLSENQLSGEIPPELGNLVKLSRLSLGRNQLSGEIPPELGGLTNMRDLSLDDNQLSGEIPPELGRLTNLEWLDMSDNSLSGEIPGELGSLINLVHLFLGENQLSGSIPSELGNLANLELLDMSDNSLDGEMSAQLGGLSNLEYLYLQFNELTGVIPPQLGGLDNLKVLIISGNDLRGSIPPQLGGLADLTYLALEDNRLHGRIPLELAQLERLRELNLSGNDLGGEIPSWLAMLSELVSLDFGDNRFSGEIPAELGNMTSLVHLRLDYNELTGEVPPQLGSLSNLNELDLTRNELGRELPDELGNLHNLRVLHLFGNEFVGGLPTWITDLPNLRVLYLGDNLFTGEIPPWLGDLERIESLYLEGNLLKGAIPAELAGLSPTLRELWLGGNKLTGEIPPELGSLHNLTSLVLGANRLTGPIPVELTRLRQLRELGLGRNQLTGEIPPDLANLTSLTWLEVEDNHLAGPIPPALGSLTNLQILLLASNDLSGEIPPELGNLANLESLVLSENDLTGTIPSELGNLVNLWRLSLEENQLSGPMPRELGNLPGLEWLILDGNRLSGSIPASLGYLNRELFWLGLANNELSGEIPASLLNMDFLGHLFLSGNSLTGCIPARVQNDLWRHDVDELGLPTCDVPITSISAPPIHPQLRINSPIPVKAWFSEPVNGFAIDEVTLANGSADILIGSDGDMVYTFHVMPTAIGDVTVNIPAGVAEYEGTSNASAHLSLGIPYDDNRDGTLGGEEVLVAVRDYFNGNLSAEHILDVIRLYFSSE